MISLFLRQTVKSLLTGTAHADELEKYCNDCKSANKGDIKKNNENLHRKTLSSVAADYFF
jgi:hypothetical protein